MFSPKIKKSIKVKGLSPEWEIKIPVEILIDLRNKELEDARGDLPVSGFRKGHATIDALINQYGERALEIAINKQLRQIADDIIKDQNYNLFTTPNITVEQSPDLENDKDGFYKIFFILKPNIDIDYKKISFDVENVSLTENEKIDEINKLAEKMGTFTLIDDESRAVKDGDSVNISFLGKIDGIPFDGGFADSYDLVIGSKTFIDGFETQLIGAKKGDKIDVSITFPEKYHSENLAGKPAVFEVIIKAISEKVKAEINEEFVKQFNSESVEEFKKSYILNIENYCNNAIKKSFKDKIFDKIAESANFEIPEKIFNNEFEYRFSKEKEKNPSLEQKIFKKENEKTINNNLRMFFVIEDLSDKEKVSVQDDEIQNFIIQRAYQMGLDPKKELEKLTKDEKQKGNIASYMKEEKIYDIVYAKITKNIKNISKTEFDKKNI